MIILPSAYLAPVGYYALLLAHGREVRIEQWEHYVKQTLRNRAVIATEAGRMALTIPVEHNGGKKMAMRDVKSVITVTGDTCTGRPCARPMSIALTSSFMPMKSLFFMRGSLRPISWILT
jgi:hypothetical protein